MRKKSIYGYVSLQEGEPLEINEQGKLVIGFRRGFSFHKERLEETKNKEALEDSIREVMGKKIPVECVLSEKATRGFSLSPEALADYFGGRVIQ
jgi:DNA polymerase-3 subunit gamma/tau